MDSKTYEYMSKKASKYANLENRIKLLKLWKERQLNFPNELTIGVHSYVENIGKYYASEIRLCQTMKKSIVECIDNEIALLEKEMEEI